MEEINVMYFHGKTVDDTRFTIAGVIKDDDLHLGISICSYFDHFNKAKGRNIATGRVLSQRNTNSGRIFGSLYSDRMSCDEFRSPNGFPENYFVGKEIKVFRSIVKNFNHFTKKELQQEFGLLRHQTFGKLKLQFNMG